MLLAERGHRLVRRPRAVGKPPQRRRCGSRARSHRQPTEHRAPLLPGASLPPDIARFARAVRGHWNIENQPTGAWTSPSMKTAVRARTRHAAINLATLRRIALNCSEPTSSPQKASTENDSAPPLILNTSLPSSHIDASALGPVLLIARNCYVFVTCKETKLRVCHRNDIQLPQFNATFSLRDWRRRFSLETCISGRSRRTVRADAFPSKRFSWM